MSYQYQEHLPAEARQRYNDKLLRVGTDICPYKIPADMWKNDPKKWPGIQYHDVYNYLIKHPRVYSAEAMENYRSLEAHTFFTSGWVQTVYHLSTDSAHFIFKADVKPSWRVTDEPHHPWVALKRDGPVAAAHCDCMAGLGETCSHIGALLFKMEAAVRLGYTASSCTDLPCQWSQCFTQNVQATPVSDIRFYKEESRNKCRKRPKTEAAAPTESEQAQFIAALANLDEPIVGLSVFKEHCDRFVNIGPVPSTNRLPPSLRTLFKETNRLLPDSELMDLCLSSTKALSVTEEQAKLIEETTRTQSSSSVWHSVRLGRLTASVAGDAMRMNLDKPSVSLVKKICAPQTMPLKVPAVEWGQQHEEDAYRLYVNLVTEAGPAPDVIMPSGCVYVTSHATHQDISVSKSGFMVSMEKPFLGASPDGIINCQCCGTGVLEIKCPYSAKDKLMTEFMSDTGCCVNSQYELKESHKFYSQVQMQMFTSEASYADFVLWTPKDCIVSRVVRNDPYIVDMVERLEKLWTNVIARELLTRSLETGSIEKENNSGAVTPSTRTFCLCKTTSEAESMVGCDRCDEWFHPKCLNLKRLPRAKTWYCPDCRKVMKKSN